MRVRTHAGRTRFDEMLCIYVDVSRCGRLSDTGVATPDRKVSQYIAFGRHGCWRYKTLCVYTLQYIYLFLLI
jgi:hypothetical protein